MRQWFAELILYSQAMTLSGSYAPFGQIAVAVLKMLAEIRGVVLDAYSVDDFKSTCPACRAPGRGARSGHAERRGFSHGHADQLGARRRQACSREVRAGALFREAVLGRRREAFQTFRRNLSKCRNRDGCRGGLAANGRRSYVGHDGSAAAGWKAALVTRPGNAALPLGDQPDIVENDLLAVAKRIISIDA